METQNRAITKQGLVGNLRQLYLRALRVSEKLRETIEMQASMIPSVFRGLKEIYFDKPQTVPPPVLTYQRLFAPGLLFKIQNPNLGFYGFDSTYGGFAVGDWSNHKVYRDRVEVEIFELGTGGGVIFTDVYILQNKRDKNPTEKLLK